ncbi:Tyrosine recombinase XerD [Pontiella desulfatans]|uniref:Tyrosine recombinase XerD n=1 Tax=Pontiella desulfatans TaxID=2750659 RepID=A0A6C2U2K0_PONDE|nr:tyrosine-type recombinase/integrase [Pontiella desulfatans]VGO13404.1 Tyrosine recombinase XerD [Pontiella desulfatans]VGO14097.1 Tyrosine recombinase XerD [Pontiella desulfatans]VGO15117.1 Tyrosine recombinase XerD [Pontiella desulfatans]VGO17678.1 Tyrosine recombinase XerD [Pontiella desulfatans]
MKTLNRELERYLSIRRGLGYKLNTDERILRRFIEFMEQEEAAHISTGCFLRWKEAFGHANTQTWSRRLTVVRIFAQWMHGIDPRHEVPPQSLIPGHVRRSRPYIYSEEEIKMIVEAAAELPSRNGIRPLTYSTFFGLIAVTGMRISEAVSLNVADVDLENGVVAVRKGKLGKERLLPVSTDTAERLVAYAVERDRLNESTPSAFFISDHGERLDACAARYNFAIVCQRVGLRPVQKFFRHGRGPRIHDLRHTFAVRTMLNWYRDGKDPAQEMIKLVTYLGHEKPAHTYWYIEAAPELLELASRRAEESAAREVES